jgi:hypothetical protein
LRFVFRHRSATRRLLLGLLTASLALLLPSLAVAHLERPSYWPDPRPDKGVTPAAGGKVPKARSLASAVTGKGPGVVNIVCQGKGGARSMKQLQNSIKAARNHGYRIRPSQPKLELSKKQAGKLLRINRALARKCEFHFIQEAVDAAGNNGRVVVMPGRYRERPSRRQPTNDPKCADMTEDNGSGGMAPSYKYQTICSNDQNLIYIQGRKVPKKPPPSPPLEEREGIPDLGPCVRCNFQIEGSGVKPTDVIMDAGMNYRHKGPGAKPGLANDCGFQPECSYAKDVVLRVDRADGFVARNFETTSSTEHGLYIEEVDGYLIDKVKMYWSAEYGNLTFTSDHGLYKNCDAYGAGDAAVYPGAAPETGKGVEDKSFYPDAPRFNTTVKKCDLRSSSLAYSGSQGNAVRITHNEIYGNTSGVVSDSISASGHPGYPPDSISIDHNDIYSNNLDSYGAKPPFVNTVGLPIGVGTFWPGVNMSQVHDNHIFDNWRRGTMLASIPTGTERGTPQDPSTEGACPTGPGALGAPNYPTSCLDEYTGNVMGKPPKGFKPSVAVHKFGNPTSLDDGAENGVDFWWDEAPTEGNCWHDNTGPDGTRDSLTADPPIGPTPGKNVPGFLPEACDSSDPTYPAGVGGPGYSTKAGMLVICGEGLPGCEWFVPPAEPGSAAAERQRRRSNRIARDFLRHQDPSVREHFHSLSTIADRR